MSENKVEIEVELVGQQQVNKGLENITKGAEGVGQTFKSVGDVVGKTNQQLGEGLSGVSDALGSTVGAVSGVKDAFSALSTGASTGLTSLLGPFALVVTAIGTAYEAFRTLSGAAKEAEDNAEAMAAAAGDLQGKLEALAEGGALPAAEALSQFTRATLDSQFAKEKLIKQYEKLTKAYIAEQSATKESARLQTELNELMKDADKAGARLVSVGADLARARQHEAKATEELNKRLEQLRHNQEAVSLQIAEAAKQEKAFEENTYDAALAKAQELAERKKALDLMTVEASAIDEATDALRRLAIEEDARAVALKLKAADDATNLEQIKAIRDELKRQIDAEHGQTEALTAQAKANQILADAQKKRSAEMKQAATARKGEEAASLARESARIQAESQLRQLEIQLTKDAEDQKLALINERYQTGLALAREDTLKRALVESSYLLDLKKYEDEQLTREKALAAESLRIEKEKRDAMIALELERRQFEIDHRVIREGDVEAQTQRDMDNLRLRYTQEFEMARDNEQRILELTERYNVERTEIERKNADAKMKLAKDVIDEYGKGFAQAAAAAIWTSKSMGEAFKAVLEGLAQESTVKALMETAYGTAALFTNPGAAPSHFASAGIFASAAALAGGLAKAIPSPKSSGGGMNKPTTSPTGLPQSTTAPTREAATASQIVYNVNFGGAVVYDTKRAAEMALTQRLDRRRGEMRGAR